MQLDKNIRTKFEEDKKFLCIIIQIYMKINYLKLYKINLFVFTYKNFYNYNNGLLKIYSCLLYIFI